MVVHMLITSLLLTLEVKKSYLIYEVKKRAKFFPSIYNWLEMLLKVNWTLNWVASTIYKDSLEHYSNLTKIIIALATEFNIVKYVA